MIRVSRAFTIVELLIVVVVIAILAAIAIVGYSGITGQARKATVEGALSGVKKSIALYSVENDDAYPETLTRAGVKGSSDAKGVTYRYSVDNQATPRTYCVTAIADSIRQHVAAGDNAPKQGPCPGHEDTRYITNFATNPSVREGNMSVYSPTPSSALGARLSATQADGLHSVMPSAGVGIYSVTLKEDINSKGAAWGARVDVPLSKSLWGKRLYVSAYTRGSIPSVHGLTIRYYGNEGQSISFSGAASCRVSVQPAFTWSDDLYTSTAPSGAVSMGVDIGLCGQHAQGVSVQVTGVRVFDSSDPDAYRDGDSPLWIWNGTPGSSSSSGPCIWC